MLFRTGVNNFSNALRKRSDAVNEATRPQPRQVVEEIDVERAIGLASPPSEEEGSLRRYPAFEDCSM